MATATFELFPYFFLFPKYFPLRFESLTMQNQEA